MKRGRPSRMNRILKGLGYGFVLLSVLGASSVYGWMKQSPLVAELSKQMIQKTDPVKVFNDHNSVTVLILGIDENRYYKPATSKKPGQVLKGGRSDVMLVAKLDFKENLVTAISIPRDLAVSVDGIRRRKINAYYERGGADGALEAAQLVLGMPIDKVIEFKYSDFRTIVDSLGGVELDVPKRMIYNDFRGDLHVNLEPGIQVLNGRQAEGYVRYRKPDRGTGLKPETDMERQARQKLLLIEIKNKVKRNPTLLTSLATSVMNAVGRHLTVEEFAAMVVFSSKVGGDHIKMGMVPVIDRGNVPGIGYILEIDNDKLDDTLVEFNFKDAPVTKTVIK